MSMWDELRATQEASVLSNEGFLSLQSCHHHVAVGCGVVSIMEIKVERLMQRREKTTPSLRCTKKRNIKKPRGDFVIFCKE